VQTTIENPTTGEIRIENKIDKSLVNNDLCVSLPRCS